MSKFVSKLKTAINNKKKKNPKDSKEKEIEEIEKEYSRLSQQYTPSQESENKESSHSQSIQVENIRDYFILQEHVGKGNFSVVQRAIDKKTGQVCALKTIMKGNMQEKLLAREISIMKTTLKHPNILKLIDVYEDKTNVYLVLHYVEGGTLFDRICKTGAFSEKEACKIVKQVLEAVRHLHSQVNVVHRDLKPENILCSGPDNNLHIYVADFGLATREMDFHLTQCGSPEYLAPEVTECQPYRKSVDLWAVGVISYVLLTGCFPFFDEVLANLFDQIRRVDYVWEEDCGIDPIARNFVDKLLVKNPSERLSVEEALEHPWIKFGNSDLFDSNE